MRVLSTNRWLSSLLKSNKIGLGPIPWTRPKTKYFGTAHWSIIVSYVVFEHCTKRVIPNLNWWSHIPISMSKRVILHTDLSLQCAMYITHMYPPKSPSVQCQGMRPSQLLQTRDQLMRSNIQGSSGSFHYCLKQWGDNLRVPGGCLLY